MAKKRILVLSPIPEPLVNALFAGMASPEQAAELEVVTYGGTNREDLLEAVKAADAIIGDYTFKTGMDERVMDTAAPCLLIQQPSTGYQHIDIDAAAANGIPVANAAGANTEPVAEHTLMCILACLKKLMLADGKTRRVEWAQDEMSEHGVFELMNKTLGIIGMGRIGREVARRALPFGCRIIYYDPVRLDPAVEQELAASFRELDQLVGESDVISVHTPYTPETDNLLSSERIAAMKQNAVVVNVARGAVIDESALASALREGRLAGAALDVFAEEPITRDNPLLGAPNTILTPHIAGATNESRLRIITLAINNVLSALRGEPPVNVVNGVEPKSE